MLKNMTCPHCGHRGFPRPKQRGSDLLRVLLAIWSLGLFLLFTKTAGRNLLLCRKCGERLGVEKD